MEKMEYNDSECLSRINDSSKEEIIPREMSGQEGDDTTSCGKKRKGIDDSHEYIDVEEEEEENNYFVSITDPDEDDRPVSIYGKFKDKSMTGRMTASMEGGAKLIAKLSKAMDRHCIERIERDFESLKIESLPELLERAKESANWIPFNRYLRVPFPMNLSICENPFCIFQHPEKNLLHYTGSYCLSGTKTNYILCDNCFNDYMGQPSVYDRGETSAISDFIKKKYDEIHFIHKTLLQGAQEQKRRRLD